MAKIILTGGMGFIGSHLIGRIRDQGDEVTVLDLVDRDERPRVARILQAADCEYLTADVRDARAVAAACDGVDVVFHLASHVGISHYLENAEDVADVIFNGTRTVARAALKRDVPMVFVSTSEVFGRNPSVPWSETADCMMGDASRPRWVYATAKLLAEQLLFDLGRRCGMRFTTLRLFNVYGPGQDSSFFITRTLWRLAHGYRPVVFDGGHQQRCFTYVGDAVDALLRAANTPAANQQAFNIGSATPITVLDAIGVLGERVGVDQSQQSYIHRSSTDLFGANYDEPVVRIPDISKARHILGWEPATPLNHGVDAILNWVHRNGWWTHDEADLA
ncbi:NAD-dependent epimerase/dehydratase family protein [Nocardia sp. NPDC088792]|uniref:NAD-dependent epimerase/dehydratase family protein n=1 Tax=Nocardia sp. NPDC088792 TaxID=3364332 RepID=UPI00381D9D11